MLELRSDRWKALATVIILLIEHPDSFPFSHIRSFVCISISQECHRSKHAPENYPKQEIKTHLSEQSSELPSLPIAIQPTSNVSSPVKYYPVRFCFFILFLFIQMLDQ